MGKCFVRATCMAGLAILIGGCARPRILEELRRDERLQRQQVLMEQEIAELEKRNEKLVDQAEYFARRQETTVREAGWWRSYGASDLREYVEVVNRLIAESDADLDPICTSYIGAACRERETVDRQMGILIADLGHSVNEPTDLVAGMTYMAEPTQFVLVLLRPAPESSSRRAFEAVMVTPVISTMGGRKQRWQFADGFRAEKGDVPAIFFPGQAGIYLDRLGKTHGRGIGRVSTMVMTAAPEVGETVALPYPDNDRLYSFALVGFPGKE